MNLIIAAIIDFFFNIPFGYWRANTKQFSWQWFASIHIPIPFIILLRYQLNIGFAFETYPVMILSFFAGQFLGKLLSSYFSKKITISNNFFKDVVKYISTK